MTNWNVLSNQEIERRIPAARMKDQLEPYQLDSKRWVLHIHQVLPEAEDNDRFAKEAVISAITSPNVCMVIAAVAGTNVTTLHALYCATETIREDDVIGAITAHALGAPISAPFHVPGHRMKLLTNELKFVPSTAIGILAVMKSKIIAHGNLPMEGWLRILQAM